MWSGLSGTGRPPGTWQHCLALHEQGKLELGGPFLLLDAGGMMVAAKEVPQEELEVGAEQPGCAIRLAP